MPQIMQVKQLWSMCVGSSLSLIVMVDVMSYEETKFLVLAEILENVWILLLSTQPEH